MITNCRFGHSRFVGIRGTGNVFEVRHSTFDLGTEYAAGLRGWAYHVQLRSDNGLFEDCRFTGRSVGIYVTAATGQYLMPPNNTKVKNCCFTGQTKYAIWLDDQGAGFTAFKNSIFEDNMITNAANGIREEKGANTIIRRNRISGGSGNGIMTSISAVNDSICNNVIYGFNGNEIHMPVGTSTKIYNNTVDGDIYLRGSTSSVVRNNYVKSLTDAVTISNNLDIDTIATAGHFRNYAAHDYRLNPAAFSSIDEGHPVSLSSDIVGTNVPQGCGPDIGAYEYPSEGQK